MSKPNVHVVHKKGNWGVEQEGSDDFQSYSTRDEAVSEGKRLAKQNHVELLVHREDGTIGERDSYGHDPRNIPG